MRVLYLSNSAQMGGGNRSLLNLWRALRGTGIEPVAVCPKDGPMVRACLDSGVPCEVVEYHQPSYRQPLRSGSTWRRWLAVLRRHAVDMVHANDVVGARSVCLAAKWLRLPLVCHVQFAPDVAFMAWAFRWLPKPDYFIYCSRGLQAEVDARMRLACPRAGHVVVHNCTVVDDFRPEARASQGLRVGIVANLVPVKGHMDFLEMAHQLTRENVDAQYWVIGGDVRSLGYGKRLEARCAELGLQDRVAFLGHCGTVPDLLRELDVVVCASHVEPFGICLIEAMAAERPVVGTRVGGIPEVIEDGVTGFLVPPATPHALAAAVRQLLEDGELRRRMGRAGRKRVETHFTHHTHADGVVQVYRELAGRFRLPPHREWARGEVAGATN